MTAGLLLGAAPPPTTPFTVPNTDACPYRTTLPPPTDLSEAPVAGQPPPGPLPRPSAPVGGEALGTCGLLTPPGSAALPEGISSAAWVVADLDTGEVLAAKDPHGLHRPASTLKVLTSLVVLRTLPLDRVIVGSQADANVEGSKVGVGPGTGYPVKTLMTGLVLQSGNDVAHALAGAMGGDAQTVAAMNSLAASLGALDTRAATPSGLDAPGQSTSAYDLALLFREAMQNPTFAELVATTRSQFPGYAGRPAFEIGNDDKLLYNYPGALGGKNGFTDDARHTFVGAALRGDRRLVVSLLDGERQPMLPWQQAAALLDWGFALPPDVGAVGRLVDSPPAPAVPTVAATPTPSALTYAATTPDPRTPDAPTADDDAAGATAPAPADDRSRWWSATLLLIVLGAFAAVSLRRRRS